MSTLGLGPVRGDAASLQKQLVSNFVLSIISDYLALFLSIYVVLWTMWASVLQMHGFDTKWMTLNLKRPHRARDEAGHGKQCYWILI